MSVARFASCAAPRAVLLVVDVIRGLLEWSGNALLIGAVAVGAYLGTRAAFSPDGNGTVVSHR